MKEEEQGERMEQAGGKRWRGGGIEWGVFIDLGGLGEREGGRDEIGRRNDYLRHRVAPTHALHVQSPTHTYTHTHTHTHTHRC